MALNATFKFFSFISRPWRPLKKYDVEMDEPIQDENKFNNNHTNYIEIWEEKGQLGSSTFDCHWKSMESRVEKNKLVFCGGREFGTYQTRYPLWSMVRLSEL